MSNVKLQLPEKGDMTENQYVEHRLVPLVADLQQLMQEFFVPGSTDEAVAVDMTCAIPGRVWNPINTRLYNDKPKSVTFSIDNKFPEMKDGKRLKVLFIAVLYSKPASPCCFRLIRSSKDEEITNSLFQINDEEPTLYQRYLPVGNEPGDIPLYGRDEDYHIEAKFLGNKSFPVCRRFSLSMVYV